MPLGFALALISLLLVPARACPGLAHPIDGELIRGFAPEGRFGGHWGVDIAAEIGTVAYPGDDGVVSFAGEVAGVSSVTVAHGDGLRTSYSYLESVDVVVGDPVTRFSVLGRTGLDHGVPALHFSVRVGDSYQDPLDWLRCLSAPHAGLRLVPLPAAYASGRATRHSRWYIRSPSPSSPFCRRSGLSRSRTRHGHFHSGRCSMAESGAAGDVSRGSFTDDASGRRRRPLLRGR